MKYIYFTTVYIHFQAKLENLKFILHCLKTDQINIKATQEGVNETSVAGAGELTSLQNP